MLPRFGFALPLVTVVALAACQGNAGLTASNPIPSLQAPAASNARSNLQALAASQNPSVLKPAPHGVRVYVHLPLRNEAQLEKLVAAQTMQNSPMYHHFLTVAQFRERFGPLASDLRAAARTLRRLGFSTMITSQGIFADAPASVVERTFDIHLRRAAGKPPLRGLPALVADRLPKIPEELSKLHAQVAAFAPLPKVYTNFAFQSKTPVQPENRYGPDSPYYWFDDLKQAYSYPSYQYANGSGRTIGIVAASDFLDSDVATYFGSEGLAPPTIVRRPVDGGSPPFDITNELSQEVSLDVQQAGGSAPGARIVVYQAPDATVTPSFVDMYTAIDEDNQADVVSTSFGLCELFFLPSYNNGKDYTYLLALFHDLFLQGNAQGITFVEASGDNGAQGGECTDTSGTNAIFGVSAWTDDPNVTGVGGTNLITSSIPGSLQSTYVSEDATLDTFLPGNGFANGAIWGSGGGKSVIWGKPIYQTFVNTGAATRSVPDLAMMMGGCPFGAAPPCGIQPTPNRSAFITVLGGSLFLLVGTSGSSSEFAGLQAIQDQVFASRTGNANYLIYLLAQAGCIGTQPVFHNDIIGNNGYPSHPGYNFVVGNGTPYGFAYALAPNAPLAGDPQTPSNP